MVDGVISNPERFRTRVESQKLPDLTQIIEDIVLKENQIAILANWNVNDTPQETINLLSRTYIGTQSTNGNIKSGVYMLSQNDYNNLDLGFLDSVQDTKTYNQVVESEKYLSNNYQRSA